MTAEPTAPASDRDRGLTDDATLAELLHGLADAVIIADVDGRMVLWNAAATRLFGWTSEEALGRSLDLIIPERFRARHWAGYEQVMESGETRYGTQLLEVPALHRDDRRLSIAFTVTLLHGADGAVRGIAAVVRDDTARRAELQALRSEVSELRDRHAEPS